MRSIFFGLLSLLLIASSAFAAEDSPAVVPGPLPSLKRHRIARPRDQWLSQSGTLISLGGTVAWQTSSDGRAYDDQVRFQPRLGYSFVGLLDVYAEYGLSTSSSDSGGNLSVKVRHNEYLLWVRHVFYDQSLLAPYAAAGLGAEQDTVTTTLGASSTRSTGRLQTLGALAGGIRFGRLFQIMLEGRLSFSAGYAPNPEPGIGVHAGFRF